MLDNGNLGIGVPNPDSKLEVAGNIHLSAEQSSTPGDPGDGNGGFIYTKADGKIYWRSKELNETDLTSTEGEAFSTAFSKILRPSVLVLFFTWPIAP